MRKSIDRRQEACVEAGVKMSRPEARVLLRRRFGLFLFQFTNCGWRQSCFSTDRLIRGLASLCRTQAGFLGKLGDVVVSERQRDVHRSRL